LETDWGTATKDIEAVEPQGLETVWEKVRSGSGKVESTDGGKPWLAASIAFCATVTKGRPLEEVAEEELPDSLPSYDVVFQGF